MIIPKLYVDPVMPGYLRFVDDPTAGFLIGMRAKEVALRLNAHDELVAALNEIAKYADPELSETLGECGNIARAVLAKVTP